MKFKLSPYVVLGSIYLFIILWVLLLSCSGCRSVKLATKKEEVKTEIKTETKTDIKVNVKVDSSGNKTTDEEFETITTVTEFHGDTATKTGIARVTVIKQKGKVKTVENAVKTVQDKTEIKEVAKVEYKQEIKTKEKDKEKTGPGSWWWLLLFILLLTGIIIFIIKKLK